MDAQEFLGRNPVFSADGFTRQLGLQRPGGERASESLLRYYTKKGRLLRVRRELYAVVPVGFDVETFQVDPYLVAAQLADDAVLGYHTTLQFYGKAYSSSSRFLYLTNRATRPLTFRSNRFRGVRFPNRLRREGKELFGVETRDRAGLPVRVTSLERTLVDVLNRPDLGGGWEEVWRSLEAVEFFDLDAVVEYTVLLGNATTAAKVGFFLSQHRARLMVEERHLHALRAHRPRSPHYMVRATREPGRFVAEWNLVVPVQVLERWWEEVP